MEQFVFLIHLFATSLMCGIIWFVQIIHYPLFNFVGSNEFVSYEREHVQRTKYLIAPLMVAELFSGMYLLFSKVEFNLTLLILNFVLLLLIWLSTFLIQVPKHKALSENPDKSTINKLVSSNWIRTLLWTSRLIVLLSLIQL